MNAVAAGSLKGLDKTGSPPDQDTASELLRVLPPVVPNFFDELARGVVAQKILLPEIDDELSSRGGEMIVETRSVLKKRGRGILFDSSVD